MYKKRLGLIVLAMLICLSGCGKKNDIKTSQSETITRGNKESIVRTKEDKANLDSKTLDNDTNESETINKDVNEPVFDISQEEALKLLKTAYNNLKENNGSTSFVVARAIYKSKDELNKIKKVYDFDDLYAISEEVTKTINTTNQILGIVNKDECYLIHIIVNDGANLDDNLEEAINKKDSYVEYYKDIKLGKGCIKCGFDEINFNAKDNIEMLNEKNIIESALEPVSEFNLDLDNIKITSIKKSKDADGDYYEIAVEISDDEKYIIGVQKENLQMIMGVNGEMFIFTIVNNENVNKPAYGSNLIMCALYSKLATNPISSEALTRLENDYIAKDSLFQESWEYGKKIWFDKDGNFIGD